MRLITLGFMLTSLVGCGSMTVKGKTKHDARTTSTVSGSTEHKVVIAIDFASIKEVCKDQPDPIECEATLINNLGGLLEGIAPITNSIVNDQVGSE